MKKVIVLTFLIFVILYTSGTVIAGPDGSGYQPSIQEIFEIFVENSENYTDISTGTGRLLKFLATDDRLVVLDYENYRILFYEKGAGFTDNQIIKIVGEHSRVQTDEPFNPFGNNRLSSEFTATIFQDTLWVTNYSFGEILRFDLDGNYLNTLPGKYRILDTDGSALYAFNNQSTYVFDFSENTFSYLKDLPESTPLVSERYGGNIKIGSDRLCIKQSNPNALCEF